MKKRYFLVNKLKMVSFKIIRNNKKIQYMKYKVTYTAKYFTRDKILIDCFFGFRSLYINIMFVLAKLALLVIF